MPTSMVALRDEHAHLLPHITELRTTADAIGLVPLGELRSLVDRCQRFLTDHLIPHARAEDEALYPVVARLMGAPEATATMRRDHVEVMRLTQELAALSERLDAPPELDVDLANDLRRTLYGLYAVVSLHFAKEEEVYVPVLEAGLGDDEAARMFDAMTAAHAAAA